MSPPMGDNTDVLVAIARIEGKLDLTLKQGEDHEARIRTIESQPTPDPETDARLRSLEERSTVSARQLWAGLISVSALVLTVLTIAEKWPQILGG